MKSKELSRLVKLGALAAMAVVAAGLLQFPILAAAPYLKYDPADVALLIGGFAFGPWWGLALVAVTAALQELVFGGAGGWIGALMHFLASGTLVVVSALLYRRSKSFKRAILALVCGAAAMTVVMIPLNLIFTPLYTGRAVSEVMPLILPAILPFNAIKAFGNALITFLLYKRVRGLLR
ncbi:MAG: ECF transporter S component [Oscillospiraceae bacterium]|jgi:riboflavin transporter FmnP|nr:ECF transporter S component [Oscillospiraceae bacterium]